MCQTGAVVKLWAVVYPIPGIIVLDQGRIVEDGMHEELIQLNGKYAQVYKNQALAMEMEITLQ